MSDAAAAQAPLEAVLKDENWLHERTVRGGAGISIPPDVNAERR